MRNRRRQRNGCGCRCQKSADFNGVTVAIAPLSTDPLNPATPDESTQQAELKAPQQEHPTGAQRRRRGRQRRQRQLRHLQ